MSRGACALAVTARDEARLLPGHLAYHRLLGIERAYVYLDEPGEVTLRSVAHLDWVSISRCVEPDRFRGVPGLGRFTECWESHMAARQSLNVVDAMSRAEAAGCEWLLSIDADELVCLDRDRMEPGALPRALAKLPSGFSSAWLPNLEVVQQSRCSGLAFREARHFKRLGGPAQAVHDPRTGQLAGRTWFFGHSDGKSLVRLGRGAVPRSSHRFCTASGGELPTATLGESLHYFAYDFQDWLRRNRNHSGHAARYVSGIPVAAHKLLWIELVDQLEESALEGYFARTLALAPDELERLQTRSWRYPLSPPVVEVRSVAEAFRHEPSLQAY
jgi:hypothetical protein